MGRKPDFWAIGPISAHLFTRLSQLSGKATKQKEIYSVLLFVLQYVSHLYRSGPPFLGKYSWLGSQGFSPMSAMQAESQKLQLTVVSCSTAISACEKCHQWEHAVSLLKEALGSALCSHLSWAWSFNFKGRRPTQKTTHPNKKSLHKQFAQTLSTCFVLILKRKGGTVCTNCPEIVCANCAFIWVGGFLLWVSPAWQLKHDYVLKL